MYNIIEKIFNALVWFFEIIGCFYGPVERDDFDDDTVIIGRYDAYTDPPSPLIGYEDSESENKGDSKCGFPSQDIRQARARLLEVHDMDHNTLTPDLGGGILYVPASGSPLTANRNTHNHVILEKVRSLCTEYGVEIHQIAEVEIDHNLFWAVYRDPEAIGSTALIAFDE